MKAVLFIALASCGAAPRVSTSLALASGLSAGDIASIEVTVIAGHAKDGSAADCANLGEGWVGLRTDLDVRFDAIVSFPDAALDKIPDGTALTVVADAFSTADGGGTRIAHACHDGVTIAAGKTVQLALTLSPLAAR